MSRGVEVKKIVDKHSVDYQQTFNLFLDAKITAIQFKLDRDRTTEQAVKDIAALYKPSQEKIENIIDQNFDIEFMTKISYPKERYRKLRNKLAKAICNETT